MPASNKQRCGARTGLFAAAVLCLGGTVAFAQAQTNAVTFTPIYGGPDPFYTAFAYAQTNALPSPPLKPWEATAAAGLTLTRGNSQTLLATLSLESRYKSGRNQASFGLAGGYGKDREVENTEFLNAYAQYRRLFNSRFYGGIRFDGAYDGIAELDYRLRCSPLAGCFLVKQTDTMLAVELGPSAVFEKHVGESEDTYLGIRFGERFDHKLSATTKIWQAADYVPKVDDWNEKYVISFEAGIDSAINKRWSLRVVFQDIYDSAPTPGREPNDLRLVAGTAFKF